MKLDCIPLRTFRRNGIRELKMGCEDYFEQVYLEYNSFYSVYSTKETVTAGRPGLAKIICIVHRPKMLVLFHNNDDSCSI